MTKSKTMDFIDTPMKMGKVKDIKNKVGDDLLNKISTGRILWHLVKRHKFSLVTTWALLITVSYVFPPFWDIVRSLVS